MLALDRDTHDIANRLGECAETKLEGGCLPRGAPRFVEPSIRLPEMARRQIRGSDRQEKDEDDAQADGFAHVDRAGPHVRIAAMVAKHPRRHTARRDRSAKNDTCGSGVTPRSSPSNRFPRL